MQKIHGPSLSHGQMIVPGGGGGGVSRSIWDFCCPETWALYLPPRGRHEVAFLQPLTVLVNNQAILVSNSLSKNGSKPGLGPCKC